MLQKQKGSLYKSLYKVYSSPLKVRKSVIGGLGNTSWKVFHPSRNSKINNKVKALDVLWSIMH